MTRELYQDYRLSDGPRVMMNLLQNRRTLFRVTFSMLLATWIQIRMELISGFIRVDIWYCGKLKGKRLRYGRVLLSDRLWALSRMTKALFQICSWNNWTSKGESGAEMQQLWVMMRKAVWPWGADSSGRVRRRSWKDGGTGRLRWPGMTLGWVVKDTTS